MLFSELYPAVINGEPLLVEPRINSINGVLDRLSRIGKGKQMPASPEIIADRVNGTDEFRGISAGFFVDLQEQIRFVTVVITAGVPDNSETIGVVVVGREIIPTERLGKPR